MRTWTEKCARKSLSRLFFAAAAVLILWGLSSPVAAELIWIEIEATSGAESAKYAWAIPKNLDDEGHMDWQMSAPLIFSGSEGLIATIDTLTLGFDGDPGVSLSFSVSAGPLGSLFTITSSTVNFAAMLNPLAYASAAITLTDTNSDGASLTGQYTGAKAYEARYNAAPIVWADILSSIAAGVDQSVAGTDRRPAAGREQILDTLTSIQSQFSFLLSANDQASGTSRFDVQPIPEPGTWLLLGTGCLFALGWVRRRNMK